MELSLWILSSFFKAGHKNELKNGNVIQSAIKQTEMLPLAECRLKHKDFFKEANKGKLPFFSVRFFLYEKEKPGKAF